MSEINRNSAREALSTAATAYHKAHPGFSPVWTGFVAICAGSSILPLFRMLIPQTSLHPIYTLTPLIWIMAGMVMIGLGVAHISSSGGMRGLQLRWSVIMVIWGILFPTTYLLAPEDYTEANPVIWFIVLPVVWAVFALAVILWEVNSLLKQEQQIYG